MVHGRGRSECVETDGASEAVVVTYSVRARRHVEAECTEDAAATDAAAAAVGQMHGQMDGSCEA